MVTARDIDKLGIQGVVDKIKKRIGDTLVYISVDIDVLDPAYAPGESCGPMWYSPFKIMTSLTGTGTAEPGGWTSRELLTILEGLEGLPVVGADVVEVAPAYDSAGEITVLAAAEIVYTLIDLMVVTPVKSKADMAA